MNRGEIFEIILGRLKSWHLWLHALAGCFIGGFSATALTFISMSVGDAARVPGVLDPGAMPWQNWLMIGVGGGITSVLGYLKEAPIPPIRSKVGKSEGGKVPGKRASLLVPVLIGVLLFVGCTSRPGASRVIYETTSQAGDRTEAEIYLGRDFTAAYADADIDLKEGRVRLIGQGITVDASTAIDADAGRVKATGRAVSDNIDSAERLAKTIVEGYYAPGMSGAGDLIQQLRERGVPTAPGGEPPEVEP